MGHFVTIYGYICVHYKERENTDKYILEYKKVDNTLSSMIFGPFESLQSGFVTYSVCGELKEYIDTNPDEFIDEFFKFLNGVSGINTVLQFESELSVYPNCIKLLCNDEKKWVYVTD
ncbi:MAG: hypothetical protein ABJN57_07425 [Hyphomicrobiales bacterium]